MFMVSSHGALDIEVSRSNKSQLSPQRNAGPSILLPAFDAKAFLLAGGFDASPACLWWDN
jgi:hypothetical protein